ncbi:hypothetical protein D9M68_794850 [compost metagenome]
MRLGGRELAVAAQLVHHGGGFALHAVQDLAALVGRGLGHRDALARQVLHEVQVIRQLLETQALEHGQHVFVRHAVAHRGGEIVGVFNAPLDATQLGEVSQAQAVQQGGGFAKRDFGVNGHEGAARDQKFRMRQRLRPDAPVVLPAPSPRSAAPWAGTIS